MDAQLSIEDGSNNHRNPRAGSSIATRARRRLAGRHRAFWTTLSIAPVAIGAGIAAALGSRRTGLISGALSALGIAAVRWQLQRWFTAEPDYEVQQRIGALEIRRYLPRVEARTRVDGGAFQGFDAALDEGFSRLAGYIFGGNTAGERLAMTAPVITEGEQLAMTAPVITSREDGVHVVSFVLPADRTLASLPRPRDGRVELVEVPERRVAVMRYRGRYRGEEVERHQRELVELAVAAKLPTTGQPSFAGFDPPWTLPLLRRNEVWINLA